MSSSQPLQDPAALRHFGATPDDVRAALRAELDAFEAQLRTREADWTAVQPGREWSPAQDTEHVIKVNAGISRLLGLLLSDRELRPTPQVPGTLKDGKRQAPEHSLPSETGLAWSSWEDSWAQHRAALEVAAANVRETPGRTIWHPFFGELDALNWLRMVAAHLHSHRTLLERSQALEHSQAQAAQQ